MVHISDFLIMVCEHSGTCYLCQDHSQNSVRGGQEWKLVSFSFRPVNIIFTKAKLPEGADQGEVWHTGFIMGAETAFSFLFFLLVLFYYLLFPTNKISLAVGEQQTNGPQLGPSWPSHLKGRCVDFQGGAHVLPQPGGIGNIISLCSACFLGREWHGHRPLKAPRPQYSLKFPLEAELLGPLFPFLIKAVE